MTGRKFSAGSGYRYGFNGKENDNEVKGEGNQQDYGMRIYDPRLGKFLSVDPLSSTYPWYTPYQFAGNLPITAIDLDGAEPKYMIDANGKLTKPVIALIMSAFGGANTDWSENRLSESTWKLDESMRKTPNIRATTNPLINGQTIVYNPLFEEVVLKNFSDPSKFEPWLNLIMHEEYHIMEQDWGVFSKLVAGTQSIFTTREKKWLEAPAYAYGHPFSLNSGVAKLLKSKNGYKLYSIMSDSNKSEQDKIREVSLIGLDYNKTKTNLDRSARASYLKQNGLSVENDTQIMLYDKRLKDIDIKISELSTSSNNNVEKK